MPVPQKKSTTSNTNPVALEQVSLALPEQQTFHEHLRALTRSTVRVVIEEVMREELKQFLGAAWGECTSASFLKNGPLVSIVWIAFSDRHSKTFCRSGSRSALPFLIVKAHPQSRF